MIKNTHRGGNTMILVNSAMMQKEIIELLEEMALNIPKNND